MSVCGPLRRRSKSPRVSLTHRLKAFLYFMRIVPAVLGPNRGSTSGTAEGGGVAATGGAGAADAGAVEDAAAVDEARRPIAGSDRATTTGARRKASILAAAAGDCNQFRGDVAGRERSTRREMCAGEASRFHGSSVPERT
jgi:hypothetical protein